MIISLLVTGYVFYLYFKLKAEQKAGDAPELNSVAELKSAIFELDRRVEIVQKRLTKLRK